LEALTHSVSDLSVLEEFDLTLKLICEIWMCNHSEVNDLHFDTRQFNHLLYDDLAKARTDLVNRIVALEGFP
jgi:hypothetical protein